MILELIIRLLYYIIWIGDIIIYNWIYDIVDLDKIVLFIGIGDIISLNWIGDVVYLNSIFLFVFGWWNVVMYLNFIL